MRFLPALLLTVILTTVAFADVLVLKDGTRLEGDVKKTDGGYEVIAADGTVTKVSAARVKSIELGKSSDASSAVAALNSLRRSVDALSDINQIIDRYQRFIDTTKDSKIIADARQDLAAWQEKRDKGLIKHGSRWMTPAEAADMISRTTASAEQARELLRAGRQVDADGAIAEALDEDPTNPAALYLRGVVLYRADKLPDARKAFEAVVAHLEKHGPTLNNLGVILLRQKQPGGALGYYDQAMQAAPVNKFILDNVADALGTLPENERKGTQFQRVSRRFAEQDTLLQRQLAPQGWFRWGSSWVDQKTLDQLRAQEKATRDKMVAMQNEFDQAKARIAQIDQEVNQNQRDMDEMRSQSVYYDPVRKTTITSPLPQAYYDLQRKNQDLRGEQTSLQAKLVTLREQAKHVEQELPVPRFTGVQQIVGVEGMPELGPAAPSTGPATAPSSPPVAGAARG